jgi:hypothetical protein
MLRWVVALLVLANGGYFLWSQGHLAPWGLAPQEQAEPGRLDTQIAPDTLRLLNTPREGEQAPAPPPGTASEEPGPAAPADAPRPAGDATPSGAAPQPVTGATPVALNIPPPDTACWQAGRFTEAQVAPLRAALARLDLPADSWRLEASRAGERWIVYLGRFDSAASLERQKAELRELKLDFRTVSAPGLGPGLALGTYSSEVAAQQALRQAARVGVRTARVAQERAESVGYTLRLPAATTAQRTTVAALGPALAGQPLKACG